MHYKNGREAKAGDKVIQLVASPHTAGIVHSLAAGSTSCNARLAITSPNDPYINLHDCLHLDDIAAASIPDCTKPEPIATS